jgi:soluble lytic murein transglycosylase
VLIRSADPAGAIVTWDALGLSNDPRLLYWRGRALAATGDPTAAAAAYEAARAADPNSFHGIEAARELGEPVEGPGGYVPLPESTAPGWAELEAWLVARVPGQPVVLPIAGAVDDLVLLGLRDEAAALLQEVAATGGPWELLAVARVAQETGLTTQALRYGFQLHAAVAPGETDIPVALLRLEYPLDYVTLLDSLARAHDLDPLWMAALVRQESLWDPRAGSIAGALGLTQVIPETGASIAANLGVTDFVTSDLFRPSTSLRFGAFYIAAQVGAFGNPYAALAAYNAGPGNAARWLEGLGGGSPADFVERIDFSETYHYVQLVSEHHAHYVDAYR